ncbi:unnamed protein product [Pedinophyceae sp. YPF-701]|nr:unnamed protein product [Pedinophyceae sp. YPF-701]
MLRQLTGSLSRVWSVADTQPVQDGREEPVGDGGELAGVRAELDRAREDLKVREMELKRVWEQAEELSAALERERSAAPPTGDAHGAPDAAAEDRTAALRADLSEARREAEQLRHQLQEANSRISELRSARDAAEDAVRDAERRLAALAEATLSTSQLHSRAAAAEAQCTALEAQLRIVRAESADLRKKLEASRTMAAANSTATNNESAAADPDGVSLVVHVDGGASAREMELVANVGRLERKVSVQQRGYEAKIAEQEVTIFRLRSKLEAAEAARRAAATHPATPIAKSPADSAESAGTQGVAPSPQALTGAAVSAYTTPRQSAQHTPSLAAHVLAATPSSAEPPEQAPRRRRRGPRRIAGAIVAATVGAVGFGAAAVAKALGGGRGASAAAPAAKKGSKIAVPVVTAKTPSPKPKMVIPRLARASPGGSASEAASRRGAEAGGEERRRFLGERS